VVVEEMSMKVDVSDLLEGLGERMKHARSQRDAAIAELEPFSRELASPAALEMGYRTPDDLLQAAWRVQSATVRLRELEAVHRAIHMALSRQMQGEVK
jgi:hypothetical protein